jgi:predicted transcriptional regulator
MTPTSKKLSVAVCNCSSRSKRPTAIFSYLRLTQLCLKDTQIEDLAREVARSSVYRVEKTYKLEASEFKFTGNKKTVQGSKCEEHTIYLRYSIKEIEKGSAVKEDPSQPASNCLSGSFI